MTKTFFFMAGLPRSGTTLLSAILNQNPNIFASAGSPMLHAMGGVYNLYYEQSNIDVPRNQDISNVIDAIPHALYKDYEQSIIIDKDFNWTSDVPFSILEHHIKNPIKIICPVRNVLEILSSFNTLAENDPGNKKDIEISNMFSEDMPMADKRAIYWMENDHSEISISLEGMKKAKHSYFDDIIHFVEYDDLINNPKEEIEKIYKFLDISEFEHNFKSIKQVFNNTDAYGLKNHHAVRPAIEKTSVDPKTVFSSEILNKYSNLEFWRNL